MTDNQLTYSVTEIMIEYATLQARLSDVEMLIDKMSPPSDSFFYEQEAAFNEALDAIRAIKDGLERRLPQLGEDLFFGHAMPLGDLLGAVLGIIGDKFGGVEP